MSVSVHSIIQGRRAVQMVESIEQAIRRGALAPGAPLPTVRALASSLGVSPTTVASAYRSLKARGLIVAQGRRGSAVSPRPPIAVASAGRLPEGVRNLQDGNPDPDLLPPLATSLAKLDASPVLYGDELVEPELAKRALRDFSGDGVPAERVAVVSGALDGLERALAAHLRPGDRVAVEDPAFTGVLDLLAALGLAPVPVAVDDEGATPAALERALASGVRAFVATPRAQNPTGAALSARRARELAVVLSRHRDVLLLEDDHAGPVSGAPARTLVTASRPHWAVVRSVAKALGPDLRVAVMAADATTLARVEGRQLLGMRWVSHLLQRLVVAQWKSRSVQAALRRAARTYTERRSAALRALSRRGLEARGHSGLNIWLPVPDEALVVQGLLDAGWGVSAGSRFRLESPPAIRVCIATLAPEDAERFAEALAGLLQPPRRSGPA